jgi:uncharacterized protein
MRIVNAARPAATALMLSLALAAPAILVGGPTPAEAQTPAGKIPPETMAAARALLQATNADAQFSAIIPLLFRQMRSNMPVPGPKEKEQVEQVFAEIQKQFMARRAELLDQIAALYAARFTVEELNAVAEFYRSPIGQKFIAAAPELAGRAMEIGNAWGRKIGQEADQTVRRELQKRGIKL